MFWGPTPWVWSYWWLCPLIGLLMFIGFMAVMRVMMGGRGLMCMSRHAPRGPGNDDARAEMQREVRALREEVDRLRASR